MARYMVELVYRYFMCMDYAVRVAVPIPYTKKIRGEEKTFHQFVDVVAFKGNDATIVECRDFKNVKKVRDSIERLIRLLDRAKSYLESKGYRVSKLLVIVEDKDLEKMMQCSRLLSSKGIEVLPLSKVLQKLVECSVEEEEYRKARGEGDTILAIIRAMYRYLLSSDRLRNGRCPS